ncbi:hypothetical protein ColTof4_00050 [Colletotrichum tofieldiae]|nr:hypothetical protein ColTof3_07249 [Colletotrichum tofieldiae]GKT67627.1 hypothetical protein ColTof4_00050 [Colletotrichum tofieldiae]GKT91419.1 hypothetical protein Ct61P_09269 [Colletotrichum tofieldiae]
MDVAGSVRVQIVRSTRSYVMSVLVIDTTRTDFTMPQAPALLKGQHCNIGLSEMSYMAPKLMATATPSLSRRRSVAPIKIGQGRNASTKSRIAE